MKIVYAFLLLVFNFAFLAQENKVVTSKEYQDTLNKEYADRSKSPLTEEDFVKFNGLDFFPIDTSFIVTARFVKAENEKVFLMKTSTDRLPKYKKYGTLYFTMQGKPQQLHLYQNMDLIKKKEYEDYLFLPFSDTTCGEESYIGGRYMDMRIPKDTNVVIDFNKAYNPYCAYNHKYSCPMVPMENDLQIAIRAGVRKFHD